MSDAIRLESPLVRFDLDKRAAAEASGAGVVVTEHAFLGHLNLRGDVSDPRFVEAVASVVGAAPPHVANTVIDAESAAICWLGPDEWLIVTSGERLASMYEALVARVAARNPGPPVNIPRRSALRRRIPSSCR